MRARMRGHDHRIGKVGGAQRRVRRRVEAEIREPVIDEVEGLAATGEARPVESQFARIDDHGIDPGLREKLGEQAEFGPQVLLLRVFIDDGHTPKRRLAARPAPFFAKHGQKGRLDRAGRGNGADALHLAAAPGLRMQELGAQEAAAGSGVDLDQARPLGA